jgi:hypothetical protein
VTSGASGAGNGTVGFTVAANTSTSSRTGTVTIAGQTFTVTQAVAGCPYALGASALAVTADGGPETVTVTTDTGCAWTAASNASWITVTSGATGTGTGSVGFTIGRRTSSAPRTGTLTIAGQTLTVTQAGVCSYTLSATSQAVPAEGGSYAVSVGTTTSCEWAVTTSVTWITVGTASGSGNGSIAFQVSGNPTELSRSGTLTIGNRTFTVTQAPATVPTPPRNFRIVTRSGG